MCTTKPGCTLLFEPQKPFLSHAYCRETPEEILLEFRSQDKSRSPFFLFHYCHQASFSLYIKSLTCGSTGAEKLPFLLGICNMLDAKQWMVGWVYSVVLIDSGTAPPVAQERLALRGGAWLAGRGKRLQCRRGRPGACSVVAQSWWVAEEKGRRA